jgi:phosphopantetheinyl transferase
VVITDEPRMLDIEVGRTRVGAALALQGQTLVRALAPDEPGEVASLLSASETSKLESLVHEKRRRDWLSGRLIGKLLVMRHLGAASPRPACVEILSDGDHKPVAGVIDDRGRRTELSWCLSISHRDGAAGAALVTSGRVGIDIEVMEPRSEALLDDYFTPGEVQMVAGLGSPLSGWGIGLFWSIKEAGLKAVGVGLSVPASDAEVLRLDEHGMTGVIALRGEALSTSMIRFDRGSSEVLAPFACLLEPPYIVSIATLP